MSNCEKCKLRARYDKNPRSLIGRLWRWHIGWCPGWKGYTKTLSDEERTALVEKYKLDISK
jgi:hypothetical protein